MPPPKNWQEFEDLCSDLWGDPNTMKNGRSGQKQKGVDIYGQENGLWCAVQCKGKDSRYGSQLTEKELLSEVEQAKKFKPKLSTFIVATTAQSDQKIQEKAREITEQNKKEDLFSVHVYSWDEIHSRLADSKYKIVLKNHYPEYYSAEKSETIQKIQVARLPHTNNSLFGRKDELAKLDDAWSDDKANIFVIKALGGAGKTALLKEWLDKLSSEKFRNAAAVYVWSFYSQGSTENTQISSDEFFEEALNWFGYEGQLLSSGYNKGLKLAELINQQKTLLILDGLEPLQYPMGTMRGLLKDQGLQALLKQLSITNEGLCLISSRQDVEEIIGKRHVTSHNLEHLKTEDSVSLLKNIGVYGKQKDLELSANEVANHALSLNLLGQYIKTVYQGDIRQRDKIPYLSSERREGKHAVKILGAYETHLEGTVHLSILYLMGLFDRPVSIKTIQYLRDKNIENLTDYLNDEESWQYAIQELETQQLINSNNLGELETLDTHPLIREYFAIRLKEKYPKTWTNSHCLLYEYYNYELTPRVQLPNNLNDMQPLFLAVSHGCLGGLYKESLDRVHAPRIQREEVNFLGNVLCAHGANLASLSNFFEKCWDKPTSKLELRDRAVLLSWSGFTLRAMGRLREAAKVIQKAIALRRKENNPIGVGINSNNLSELWVIIGDIDKALKHAKISIKVIPKHKYILRLFTVTTLADAQHKSGNLKDAYNNFVLAEQLLDQYQPGTASLYSSMGFRACDFLLTVGDWHKAERIAHFSIDYVQRNEYEYIIEFAWFECFLGRAQLQKIITFGKHVRDDEIKSLILQNPSLFPSENTIFNVLLDYSNKNEKNLIKTLKQSKDLLDKSIESFYRAAQEFHTPLGFLSRAKLFRWSLSFGVQHTTETEEIISNKEQALSDLKEVYEISKRCDMDLYLTDYHLECARLSLTTQEEIFDLTVDKHIEKAKFLIIKTGYKLRTPELEYLEKILLSK
jgi:hypothetical protein